MGNITKALEITRLKAMIEDITRISKYIEQGNRSKDYQVLITLHAEPYNTIESNVPIPKDLCISSSSSDVILKEMQTVTNNLLVKYRTEKQQIECTMTLAEELDAIDARDGAHSPECERKTRVALFSIINLTNSVIDLKLNRLHEAASLTTFEARSFLKDYPEENCSIWMNARVCDRVNMDNNVVGLVLSLPN